MYKARRKFKDSSVVNEAFYPDCIEGFGHVEEHRFCQPPLAEIPGYSLNESGQLQGLAEPRSKPKLFVPKQPTLAYLMQYPGEQDLLKDLANRV